MAQEQLCILSVEDSSSACPSGELSQHFASTLPTLCQHFGNACAFKSFKGSRREPLPVSQSTFPSHYPGSVLLCVIETVVTVKAVWVNSQEKNDMKLQHLVAFSEVNVCLTSKSLIRGSVCWGVFFWWLLL